MAQILHATLNHANLNMGIPRESHQRAVGITPPDYNINAKEEIDNIVAKLNELDTAKELPVQKIYELMEIPIFNEKLNNRLFWEIRWHAGKTAPGIRWIINILLVTGFAFAAIILLYQAISLYIHFWPQIRDTVLFFWLALKRG